MGGSDMVSATCTTVFPVYASCVSAIREGQLISRANRADKEFHFQNWFERRLREANLCFDQTGRNTYPDYTMVHYAEGYELKGLAYPGRDATFDSNSQVPKGLSPGKRAIYYVFGRYPKEPDGDSYPVLDLVICHGDFLNADREYVHENKSVRGFGSYGDILIRDRKMYVVPTPFKIAEGLAHHQTLILPYNVNPPSTFIKVGELTRVEVDEVIVGYDFNLRTNEIGTNKARNPNAGVKHIFSAWRLEGASTQSVTIRQDVSTETDCVDNEEGAI
jgi:hypothetical protein